MVEGLFDKGSTLRSSMWQVKRIVLSTFVKQGLTRAWQQYERGLLEQPLTEKELWWPSVPCLPGKALATTASSGVLSEGILGLT